MKLSELKQKQNKVKNLTEAELAAYAGFNGEIVTCLGRAYVMDGATNGGIPIAKKAEVDAINAITGALGDSNLEDAINRLGNIDYMDRADKRISLLSVYNMGYSDGTTVQGKVSGDIAAPNGKLELVKYTDNTDGTPIEVMVYNSAGKLARVDHYMTKSLYDNDTDGSKRAGYTTLQYVNGKLDGTPYTDVAETQKGDN